MDQRTVQVLFALFRSAIRGTEMTERERKLYTPELLSELHRLAARHDLSHLLAFGMKQNGLISREQGEIEKAILMAIFRCEHIRYECEALYRALEGARIPFLPLKGAVIRSYYPEPWMRTSCDIDVLVREEDAERAKELLVGACGYTYHTLGSHDISLTSPDGVHVELHYSLMEEGNVKDSHKVLKTVWDTAHVREGMTCLYEMSDEMLCFYHIAHMAKHVGNGGCGIRPFIDLWILDHISDADQKGRDRMLAEGGLLTFSRVARKLSRILLEDEAHDDLSMQLEDYILHGGVYGNSENRIAIGQQKKGGHIRYVLSKIFLPYDVIKFHYPILQKHRLLTPLMQLRRWGRLIFGGHARRVVRELRYSQSIPQEKAMRTRRFLEQIGL